MLNPKPGDIMTKYLSSERVPMTVKVQAVRDGLVYTCPPEMDWPLADCWTHRQDTGGEVDDYFGWDGVTVTGSMLEEVQQ